MKINSLIAILIFVCSGMIFCLILAMGLSIVIASSPTSKIIQHDLSLLDNAAMTINESTLLNETEHSLNNAEQNLSLFNGIAIGGMVISGVIMSIVFFIYRKYLDKLKLISRLSESSTIAIALLFGLTVLFYTSADLTNLSLDQTITQVLSTIMSSDKNHEQQIKLLNNFVIDKIGQYRIDIENSVFFGSMTLIVLINLLVHKFKLESVIPYIVFFAVIGAVVLWAEGYMVNPEHSQPFVSCIKVHC